jgi:hypothetical protein
MKTWDETKEQRKHRKARERMGLSLSDQKRYVFCLKWGTKYGPEYVNKLYNMVQRNTTLDYEFICLTENKTGLDPHIKTYPLPNIPVTGWWYKVWVLSNLPFNGVGLFLDLDLIVFQNIDKLWTYKPASKFVIIRDFNRISRPNFDKMNSSVFRFNIGAYSSVYDMFAKDPSQYTRRMQGDQDFMYKTIKDHEFWPDEWIQSYKWEMRSKNELTIVNGQRNFAKPGTPRILPNTSIAVFHGQPNIPDCVDEWPRANWR